MSRSCEKGDGYRMWFSWRPRKSIALVESSDGVHWSQPRIVLAPNPESDWEADLNRPAVVKRPGGYHLWYTGQARGQSWIGHATSADGLSWKRAGSRQAHERPSALVAWPIQDWPRAWPVSRR